jgi:hypothetical protein
MRMRLQILPKTTDSSWCSNEKQLRIRGVQTTPTSPQSSLRSNLALP